MIIKMFLGKKILLLVSLVRKQDVVLRKIESPLL